MQDSDTNCRVRLLGPIHDPSVWDALAEIVIIAFRKSPAEVCVEARLSGAKFESNLGIKSCLTNHCVQSEMEDG